MNVPSPPPERRRAMETMAVHVAVAALVADDGTRTLLDRNYVFGREPWQDPEVVSGAFSPIVVRDSDNLISRVQVHVWVEEGAVMLRDSYSANGTFIAPPGALEWVRLGPFAAPLPPGWSIRMGRRIFTYVAAES